MGYKVKEPHVHTSDGKNRNLLNMKKLILLLLIAQPLFAQEAPKTELEKPERHEFVIANFHTEGGVTLPQARVVYGTYGHLDAAKDNVVLLPSHYMADFHGYEWLIGPDKALDASKLFLVATELFGSGHSSSPSNTPEPFHGLPCEPCLAAKKMGATGDVERDPVRAAGRCKGAEAAAPARERRERGGIAHEIGLGNL